MIFDATLNVRDKTDFPSFEIHSNSSEDILRRMILNTAAVLVEVDNKFESTWENGSPGARKAMLELLKSAKIDELTKNYEEKHL